MGPWVKVAVLSIGGVFGVNARYWLGVWISRWASPQFPWATFMINVSGSFLIGFLTLVLTHWLPHPNLRLLVITGFLGGYTTFSTFEHESATLLERGELWLAIANLMGSVVAGFVAVALGIALAQGLIAPSASPARRAVADGPAPVTPGPRTADAPETKVSTGDDPERRGP